MEQQAIDMELMPREKLLQFGAESLTDEELLAIFLRTGIKGIPLMVLADSVLVAFGSLRELLSASREEFCQIKGLGLAQYVQLQATKEMTKRYLSQQMQFNEAITDPFTAVMYFQTELEDYEREVFMVLFLDNQNRLIRTEKMFFGTINQANVYPREVVKAALRCNAAAVIVAHNHPSGSCTPSESDRKFTQRLEMACDLVDVRFVDHIIVGKGDYFSFTEEKVQAEIE